jgi:hypothetical protein
MQSTTATFRENVSARTATPTTGHATHATAPTPDQLPTLVTAPPHDVHIISISPVEILLSRFEDFLGERKKVNRDVALTFNEKKKSTPGFTREKVGFQVETLFKDYAEHTYTLITEKLNEALTPDSSAELKEGIASLLRESTFTSSARRCIRIYLHNSGIRLLSRS